MMKKHLLELPIDVYTRHYIAADIVENIARNTKQQFSILDLGGFKGWTSTFFPQDHVTVMDVYKVKDKGYIQGDATEMAFNENTFDIVTSFDVFEHIPREKRERFITESFRVSSDLVIITVPTNANGSHSTSNAEINLNNFFKIIANKDHPWLKEHIEYGIPSDDEIENILHKKKYAYRVIKSNNLDLWQMVEAINFLGTVDQSSLDCARKVNSIYNANTEVLEFGVEDPYRSIFIIFKNKTLLQRFDSYVKAKDNITQLNRNDIKNSIAGMFYEQVAGFMQTILLKNEQTESLRKEFENKIQEQNQIINNIQNSKSWKLTEPLRRLKFKVGK